MTPNDHTPFPWHCVNYAGYIRIQDEPFYDANDIFDEEKVGEHRAAANSKIIESLPEIFEQNAQLLKDKEELLNALSALYNSVDSCVELTPELLQSTNKLIQKHRP